MVLICIFLINDFNFLSIYHLYFFFGDIFFSCLDPFSDGIVYFFFMLSFESSLFNLDISLFVSYVVCKYIFYSVICLFILLTVCFTEQTILILMRSNLSIFFIWITFFMSNLKTFCLTLDCKHFLLCFFLKNKTSTNLCFMFKPMIYF